MARIASVRAIQDVYLGPKLGDVIVLNARAGGPAARRHQQGAKRWLTSFQTLTRLRFRWSETDEGTLTPNPLFLRATPPVVLVAGDYLCAATHLAGIGWWSPRVSSGCFGGKGVAKEMATPGRSGTNAGLRSDHYSSPSEGDPLRCGYGTRPAGSSE